MVKNIFQIRGNDAQNEKLYVAAFTIFRSTFTIFLFWFEYCYE